ncbi:MAG TPA: hypothetical protein V6D05_01280 [Stenomitos sp.]
MGIEGISGGHMARLQGLQANQPSRDIQRMQEAGSELDQKVKQLEELIKNAIANGANPEALRALQAQLAQLQQGAAQPANDPTQGVDAAGGGGQGGTNGAAALEMAKKLDDIKKQIETIAQTAGMEASGFSQQSQQQAQQLLAQQALGQDQNMVRGRDMSSMY